MVIIWRSFCFSSRTDLIFARRFVGVMLILSVFCFLIDCHSFCVCLCFSERVYLLSAPSVFLNFPLLFVLCSSVCVCCPCVPSLILLTGLTGMERERERGRAVRRRNQML